jgi:hypothetical protein
MLTLILKLGEEKLIVDIPGYDVNPLLNSLKSSVILDSDGVEWIIDSDETLYFESFPPHFEISCDPKESPQ